MKNLKKKKFLNGILEYNIYNLAFTPACIHSFCTQFLHCKFSNKFHLIQSVSKFNISSSLIWVLNSLPESSRAFVFISICVKIKECLYFVGEMMYV